MSAPVPEKGEVAKDLAVPISDKLKEPTLSFPERWKIKDVSNNSQTSKEMPAPVPEKGEVGQNIAIPISNKFKVDTSINWLTDSFQISQEPTPSFPEGWKTEKVPGNLPIAAYWNILKEMSATVPEKSVPTPKVQSH